MKLTRNKYVLLREKTKMWSEQLLPSQNGRMRLRGKMGSFFAAVALNKSRPFAIPKTQGGGANPSYP